MKVPVRLPAKWFLEAVGWVIDWFIAREDKKVRLKADDMVRRSAPDAKTRLVRDPKERGDRGFGDFER